MPYTYIYIYKFKYIYKSMYCKLFSVRIVYVYNKHIYLNSGPRVVFGPISDNKKKD